MEKTKTIEIHSRIDYRCECGGAFAHFRNPLEFKDEHGVAHNHKCRDCGKMVYLTNRYPQYKIEDGEQKAEGIHCSQRFAGNSRSFLNSDFDLTFFVDVFD